jgi:hypothetical protein
MMIEVKVMSGGIPVLLDELFDRGLMEIWDGCLNLMHGVEVAMSKPMSDTVKLNAVRKLTSNREDE